MFKKKYPKEIQEGLSALNEIIPDDSFQTVLSIKKEIKKYLIFNPKNMANWIRNQPKRSMTEYVYAQVGNLAGDLLESGNYHVYRGILNSEGQELLKLFDKTYDLLLEMKTLDVTQEYATKQKRILRNNINKVG